MAGDIVLDCDKTYYLTNDIDLSARSLTFAEVHRPNPYPADDTAKRIRKIRRTMKRLGMVEHGR